MLFFGHGSQPFQKVPELAPTVCSRDSTQVLSEHDKLIIVGLLLDDPSLYLNEVCQRISLTSGLEVSPATVCRVIHQNGFTRKKLQQTVLQRSVEYRGQFFNFLMLGSSYGWMKRDLMIEIRGENLDTASEVKLLLVTIYCIVKEESQQ